jgi:hypothetical protein
MKLSSVSTNEHGVKGRVYKTGLREQKFIPECCIQCNYLDIESKGDRNQYFVTALCGIFLRIPTKKGSCKRQSLCK